MTIDQNDTSTTDLLDNLTNSPDDNADALREKLELATRRAYGLEKALVPLQALADAIAALPVFVEMAADLEDLNNRLASIEMARDETPTLEDVVQEIEYSGSIEDAVATVLADRSEHPADDIDGLAAAVAEKLSVEVEIDDITVEASASVSVA